MVDGDDNAESVTGAGTPSYRVPPVETRFKKGQSGNPRGRPKKLLSAIDVANENCEKALKKLVKLIDSKDERVSLQAATVVVERALGKAKQALDITKKQDAADYSDAELLAIARLGRSRVAQTADGEDEPHRVQ